VTGRQKKIVDLEEGKIKGGGREKRAKKGNRPEPTRAIHLKKASGKGKRLVQSVGKGKGGSARKNRLGGYAEGCHLSGGGERDKKGISTSGKPEKREGCPGAQNVLVCVMGVTGILLSVVQRETAYADCRPRIRGTYRSSKKR